MKPDASPLVSKLTLLILTLILACLVLLVVRSYQGHRAGAPVATSDAETTEPAKPMPKVVTPLPAPVVKRPPPVSTPSTPTNLPAPAQAFASSNNASQTSEPHNIGRVVFGPTDHRPAGIYETLAANGSALLAGTVTLRGTPKPETPITLQALGPTCSSLQPQPVTTRHFVVGPKGELANVVVYIKSGLSRKFGPVQPGPLIDQVGCMFEPYVSAVVAGQTFQIRNSDATLHNVHATPRLNKEFNFGQPVKGQVNTFSFAQPEMHVRIKCDVHPWMFTYVSVFDHPYFAVTDTNGFFQLPAQIPAGKYAIFASHLKLGVLYTDNFELREGEQRSLQFEFNVPANLQAAESVARSN